MGKARAAFQQLKDVWRSSLVGTSTKIRIFNTIVKPVLLYGADTWRTTVTTMKIIQTFINTFLRRILKMHWSDIISNHDLWKRTRQKPMDVDIFQRSNVASQAFTWKPQGKRKRGRPRNSWRRDLDANVRRNGFTWGELQQLAQDGQGRRVLVGGLCPRRVTDNDDTCVGVNGQLAMCSGIFSLFNFGPEQNQDQQEYHQRRWKEVFWAQNTKRWSWSTMLLSGIQRITVHLVSNELHHRSGDGRGLLITTRF